MFKKHKVVYMILSNNNRLSDYTAYKSLSKAQRMIEKCENEAKIFGYKVDFKIQPIVIIK